MQVGGFLVPALSLRDALLAIVAGSALGAGLLAWVAAIGCRARGCPAQRWSGTRWAGGSPCCRWRWNVLQLLGWTAFELVVMRDGTAAIVRQPDRAGCRLGADRRHPGLGRPAGVALAGGTMTGLVRRFVSRFGLPLVVVSLCWLSWQFWSRAQAQGFDALWSRPGDGSMSALSALDLVIAMPVSWLPLVADFCALRARGVIIARHLAGLCAGQHLVLRAGRAGGQHLGAGTPNWWPPAAGPGRPGGAGLILIDEVDNAYGDVHSGAVSVNFLRPHDHPPRRHGAGRVGTACALVLPMHSLEPFMLLLSSIFVPLFGVVIAARTGLPPQSAACAGASGAGLAGIVVFHAGAQWWPAWARRCPAWR